MTTVIQYPPCSGPVKTSQCATSRQPKDWSNQRGAAPFAKGLSSTNINPWGFAHRQTKTHSADAQSVSKAMLLGL